VSFTETQCDAMDARRDQQKEDRLNAKRLQSIPVLADVVTPAAIVAVELMRLFDSLPLFGYSQIALFEHDAPGATAALRAWAEANGHPITEETTTDGHTTVLATQVRYPGPWIQIYRKTGEVTP